jgi:hypothetical protein
MFVIGSGLLIAEGWEYEVDGGFSSENVIGVYLSGRRSLEHVGIDCVFDFLEIALVTNVAQEKDGFLTPGHVLIPLKEVAHVFIHWLRYHAPLHHSPFSPYKKSSLFQTLLSSN